MDSTARLDRSLLLLLGLLLTAAGVLGLLVGFDVLGGGLRGRPVLDNVVGRFFGTNGGWLWPVIALFFLQLRPTGVRDLELEPRSSTGHTDLVGAALLDAVVGEIRSYRGVAAAGGRLTGHELSPELRLRVQLDSRADVAALRRRIETGAISDVRQALDNPQLPVRLDLVVTAKAAARVA